LGNPWQPQLEALGDFLRTQRKLANLSLRELAALTDVSNAYLSQIERGLHEPSVRVLRSIAQALEISANTVLAQAGLLNDNAVVQGTEEAIRADSLLSTAQKEALLGVYRSYVRQREQARIQTDEAAEEPAAATDV
jgi:transcriptional regulator with XRE-family HTH domain